MKVGWEERHIQAGCYRIRDETGEIVRRTERRVENTYLNLRLL